MTSDKALDTLKEIIRSLLVAEKGPVPLTRFLDDYAELEGCQFPYKEYKFDSPVTFLETLSDAVVVLKRGMQVSLLPCVTKELEHVREKVLNQKSSAKAHQKRPHSHHSNRDQHEHYHQRYYSSYNEKSSGRWNASTVKKPRSQNYASSRKAPLLPVPPAAPFRVPPIHNKNFIPFPVSCQPRPDYAVQKNPACAFYPPLEVNGYGVNIFPSYERSHVPVPYVGQSIKQASSSIFNSNTMKGIEGNSRSANTHNVHNKFRNAVEANSNEKGMQMNGEHIAKEKQSFNKCQSTSSLSEPKPVAMADLKSMDHNQDIKVTSLTKSNSTGDKNLSLVPAEKSVRVKITLKNMSDSTSVSEQLKPETKTNPPINPWQCKSTEEPEVFSSKMSRLKQNDFSNGLGETSGKITGTKPCFYFSSKSFLNRRMENYNETRNDLSKAKETMEQGTEKPLILPKKTDSLQDSAHEHCGVEVKHTSSYENKSLDSSSSTHQSEHQGLPLQETSQKVEQNSIKMPEEKKQTGGLQLKLKPFRIVPEGMQLLTCQRPSNAGNAEVFSSRLSYMTDSQENHSVGSKPSFEKQAVHSECSLSDESEMADACASAMRSCPSVDSSELAKIHKVIRWLFKNDYGSQFSYCTFKDKYEEVIQETFTQQVNRTMQKLPGIKITGGFIIVNDTYKKEYLLEASDQISDDIYFSTDTDDQYTQQELSEDYKFNILSSSVEVQVTEVINPGNFYVLLLGNDTANQLWTLMDNMNTFYENPEYNRPLKKNCIRINKPCAVPYPTEEVVGDMHRAIIKKILSEKMVEIEYVDFGTTASVNVEHLKEIPGIFLSLPKQAIRVKLFQTFPRDSKGWSTDATQRLLDMVKQKVIRCCFMEKSGDVYPVVLCDTNGSLDAFIHLELEKEGLVNIDHNMNNLLQDAPRFQRVFEIVILTTGHILHIIDLDGTHYISSDDLANFFDCDSTQIEERLSSYDYIPIVISETEYPQLFQNLPSSWVNGIVRSEVHVFELCSAYVILNFLEHPNKLLINEVKEIAEKYSEEAEGSTEVIENCLDNDSSSMDIFEESANCNSDEDLKEPEDIEDQFRELRSRRLACLKLLTSYQGNPEELVTEIDHLEKELNYLSLKYQGEDRGTADGSCEPSRKA